MTEENLDPEAIGPEGEDAATDKVFDPSAIAAARLGGPSGLESTDRPSAPSAGSEGAAAGTDPAQRGEGHDRGRTIALAVLAGLVALGLVLIARGPRAPGASPATGAAAAGATEAGVELSAVVIKAVGLGVQPALEAGAADAGPRFVPVWRVAALEHDAGIEIVQGTLGKRNFADALSHAGISKAEVRRVMRAADNIRRIERGGPKDSFVVARDRSKGAVVAFEFIASPTEIFQAKTEDGFVAKRLDLFVEKRRVQGALAVTSDLAKAIAAAGLHEQAIEEIADALEGHSDTAVVRPGVRLRVTGSEEWVEGAFARLRVDAVEYVPKTGATLRMYYYERDRSESRGDPARRRAPHAGFYDAKGQQPFHGAFRSPIPLARITSRYNPKRLHPVLHVVMPHNGMDFGAGTGTPIYASAAGTVHSVGDGGPCGNMVQIEHAGGLTTAYCHLSRFAAGLHAGQHVEARQLVGYVGATGRVTGPHLHFAVKRHGVFVDPAILKMDGVRTLPPADREVFAKRRAELDAALEAVALPSADGSADKDDDDKDEDKDEMGDDGAAAGAASSSSSSSSSSSRP